MFLTSLPADRTYREHISQLFLEGFIDRSRGLKAHKHARSEIFEAAQAEALQLQLGVMVSSALPRTGWPRVSRGYFPARDISHNPAPTVNTWPRPTAGMPRIQPPIAE